ncbi:betaine aldehyde dehydrogenase [Globomyces pollinis-pini]|nr:betaine aldehyde dehydrogenase [Globomyces pollinis-pini]
MFSVKYSKPFVASTWLNTTLNHNLINPWSKNTITIHHNHPSDVENAVAIAKNSFKNWSQSSPKQRSQILLSLANKIESNLEEISWLESQGGKPIQQAREDIIASIDVFKYFATQTEFTKDIQSRGNNSKHYTIRQPIGVCGLITSFNYPFLLTAWKVAPALAVGNTIVLKPAPQTPLSTLFLAHLTTETDLPTGVFNVILGERQVGESLVKNKDVSMISFTGSTPVGKQIASECATLLRPSTLELGGKNAAIVFADADLQSTTKLIIDGAFSNMGQNCCGISRLFVHSSIYNDLIVRLTDATKALVIGDPSLEHTQIGPVIDQNAFDRIYGFIQRANQNGIYPVIGGQDYQGKHCTITPTIFTNVPDNLEICQTELFGPVLTILQPFETEQEVISRVNDTEYGLACGIFTSDDDRVIRLVNQLETGMIWHNTYNDIPPYMPFGGLKQSGWGKDLGSESLNTFTTVKSIVGV